MTSEEIRWRNLVWLFRQSGLRFDAEFASKIGIAPGYYSQVMDRKKNIGNKVARRIEKNLNKPIGWMDIKHDAEDDRKEIKQESKQSIAQDDDISAFVVLKTLPDSVQNQVKKLIFSIAAELPTTHKINKEHQPFTLLVKENYGESDSFNQNEANTKITTG